MAFATAVIMIHHRYTLLVLALTALQGCANSPTAEAQLRGSQPIEAQEAQAETIDSAISEEEAQQKRFEAWKTDFINRAASKGYDRSLVEGALRSATINERALERDSDQPEFTKPVWSYVDNAVSVDRLNTGTAKLIENETVFNDVEARYHVPRHILTSIWGLETAYGRIMGTHDIISSLATFAFEGRRTEFGEQQLFAVLDLLQKNEVRADQLTGSWAGAMGMTQFIPTTFRDYAVDFNRDGNKNLWTDPYDALGSAAHYLSRHGWRKGEPVMTEVIVPTGFDYSLAETSTKTVDEWASLGVRPVTGQAWTEELGPLNAEMIAPAGHRGPIILTFKNFYVIKKYNNSTSYAMGITVLADALRGVQTLKTDWPRGDEALSFDDKKAMQVKLTQLGFDTKGVDGQIGPNTRKAIRSWQKNNGLPADGYMEQILFKRLMTS